MNILVKMGKTIWEKLNRTNFSEKDIFAFLLVGIVITLIPMLIIAKYNVPCADDYSYGRLTHLAWERSHSLLNVLYNSARQAYRSYLSWQGTYSAIIAFTLQPAVFGEKWYPITTYIMLISLCGGIAYLFATVFRQILNAAWYQSGIVITVLIAICTQLLPSPDQAFYWYNGSVYYTFFFGLSLVLYTKVLIYIRLSSTALSPVKRKLRLLSLSFLSAVIAGTNYVTALTTAILYVCVLALILIQKKRSCLGLVVPFCVFTAGFIFNVLAPGNSARQSHFLNHPTALSSIFLSFRAAINCAHSWLTPSLFFLVIFLLPLFYKIAAKTKYSYSYPLLILLGSFCLFSSMFCPPIYAMGNIGPGRLVNNIYYAFVILLILNLFYVSGWCKRIAEKHGIGTNKCERPGYSLAFLLVVFILFLSGSVLAESHYTSSNALRELLQGEASAYYDTAKERLELLKDDSQQDVVLPRYSVKPWILYFNDITEDPSDWRNTSMSDFYQKNSVVLEPEG